MSTASKLAVALVQPVLSSIVSFSNKDMKLGKNIRLSVTFIIKRTSSEIKSQNQIVSTNVYGKFQYSQPFRSERTIDFGIFFALWRCRSYTSLTFILFLYFFVGWYEGMRLRDGEQGWFPANHTEEIHSEHARARNLMQRFRLINATKQYMNTMMKK